MARTVDVLDSRITSPLEYAPKAAQTPDITLVQFLLHCEGCDRPVTIPGCRESYRATAAGVIALCGEGHEISLDPTNPMLGHQIEKLRVLQSAESATTAA